MTPWRSTWRADPAANRVAKGHYTCQSPGSGQFVPPGRSVVLVTPAYDALWVTSWPYPEFVKHAWPGAWVCSLFRRLPHCPSLASDLIRAAVAATRAVWPDVPGQGMVTFVDPGKVRRKRDPGRCFFRAGFRYAGTTRGGLPALLMTPDEMPAPEPAVGHQAVLFP